MHSTGPATTPLRQVSRFEASLLRILRFFFGQVPAEEALPLIRASMIRPPCLSSSAVHLVRDSLSKGCVLYLVRAGSWKNDRYLRSGEPKAGRLWARSPLDDLKLEFSSNCLEFLLWLTAHKPTDGRPLSFSNLTEADQLFFFLAYKSMQEEPDLAPALRAIPVFAENPLCRLFFPGDFADDEHAGPVNFDPWVTGRGSLIVEAMQSALEARWLEIEHSKGLIGDWERMRRLGQAELLVLGAFLDAADRANRWDLSRFLLHALNSLLATPNMSPTFWTGGLQGSGPVRLADRLECQRSALSLLQQAERFRQWEQRARTRGYFDEDYEASKFWLSEWERVNGDRLVDRARQVIQTLEPLRT